MEKFIWTMQSAFCQPSTSWCVGSTCLCNAVRSLYVLRTIKPWVDGPPKAIGGRCWQICWAWCVMKAGCFVFVSFVHSLHPVLLWTESPDIMNVGNLSCLIAFSCLGTEAIVRPRSWHLANEIKLIYSNVFIALKLLGTNFARYISTNQTHGTGNCIVYTHILQSVLSLHISLR
jgi:hypothetical protein